MHEPYHLSAQENDPFTETKDGKAMSPVGRFLLRMCSNDMRINLNDPIIKGYIEGLHLKVPMVRLTALHLGITLEGGS